MASEGSPPPPMGTMAIQATWIEDPNIPVWFANAFAVQPIQNEFILTFAVAVPPVFTKAPTAEDLAKVVAIIKPIVRIGITPDRAFELIQLLQKQLSAYTQVAVKN